MYAKPYAEFCNSHGCFLESQIGAYYYYLHPRFLALRPFPCPMMNLPFLQVVPGAFALLTASLACAQTPATNRITLLSLNQPPCATLQPTSVIRAKLAYSLADAEQSAEGFSVSIKFQSTNPNMTFSDGQQGQVAVTARHDTLTITYPVAAIRHNTRLQRPVTCYFYLHRHIGANRSVVLAKTAPVVFQECQ